MDFITKKNRGFTLIEIMIALLIFAFIAAIAASSLHTLLKARTRINANTKFLQQLQFAMTIMGRDIQQIVKRSVTDKKGNKILAIVIHPTKPYLEFTHGGFANPLAIERRSTLQRVAYLLKKNALIRRTWPVLDRASETKYSDKALLTGVKSLRFSILRKKKQREKNQWRENQTQAIPRAIQMTLDLTKWGGITRTWRVLHNVALP